MRYQVIVTEDAQAEAEKYADFIRRKSNDSYNSDEWWNGLLEAILSLERLPARCPAIPEQDDMDVPTHQLLYQSHRIVFQLRPMQVDVLRICHTAMKPLTAVTLRKRPKHKSSS